MHRESFREFLLNPKMAPSPAYLSTNSDDTGDSDLDVLRLALSVSRSLSDDSARSVFENVTAVVQEDLTGFSLSTDDEPIKPILSPPSAAAEHSRGKRRGRRSRRKARQNLEELLTVPFDSRGGLEAGGGGTKTDEDVVITNFETGEVLAIEDMTQYLKKAAKEGIAKSKLVLTCMELQNRVTSLLHRATREMICEE